PPAPRTNPRQPPDNRKLRLQHVPLCASCQPPSRRLFGQPHRLVCQQASHRRGSSGRALVSLGQFPRPQKRRLKRVDLHDHVGQVRHYFLLFLQRRHEPLAGYARRKQRHLLGRSKHNTLPTQHLVSVRTCVEAGRLHHFVHHPLDSSHQRQLPTHRTLHQPAGNNQPVDLI